MLFTADAAGPIRFCFSNKISTVTHKVVMFSIDVTEAAAAGEEDEDETHSKVSSRVSCESKTRAQQPVYNKKADGQVFHSRTLNRDRLLSGTFFQTGRQNRAKRQDTESVTGQGALSEILLPVV